MAEGQSVSVKDVVYKLQLSLLEGIKNEDQLFAAGSLMSRGDYQDVVVERSISSSCGYPLCDNLLPADRPQKGRYRIALKEHKVYDLQETHMFCSSSCLINSRAFGASLEEERSADSNPEKVSGVLRLFEELSLDEAQGGLGKKGGLGLSKLTIQEKPETKAGEVRTGPSDAIEGYVPQRVRNSKPSPSATHQQGLKSNRGERSSKQSIFIDEMDFMSTIITNDEYSISKAPLGLTESASGTKPQKENKKEAQGDLQAPKRPDLGKTPRKLKAQNSKLVSEDGTGSQELSSTSTSTSCLTSTVSSTARTEEETQAEIVVKSIESIRKSSLKSSGAKKLNRSITWADEKADTVGSRNLCEVREMEDTQGGIQILDNKDMRDDDSILHFGSAEACAIALSHAAEVVASGDVDSSDAMSEAGVMVLPGPGPHNFDQGDPMEVVDMHEKESPTPEWPGKPGISHSEFFYPEDSCYDTPPEGFSLELSPFATMWMALFAWITSSSLAYIYGRDVSSFEDYSMVNGREYPRKIVLEDGRSSEIKRTIEGCLARAFPGLVADLRLPMPLSTLEQGAVHLLETMSFVDALPPFRTKQWQVVALLFIEALSVCRLPALISYMDSRRMVLHKVLDGARISAEEYEVMKDLVMRPLAELLNFHRRVGHSVINYSVHPTRLAMNKEKEVSGGSS